jgi:hypothetical protein
MGWTTPRVRRPEQADRWSWLVVAAYTQLRLARLCCGPASAVGAPLRCGSPDANTGPSRRFDAFGGEGHARKAAETLRKITWQGETLPGGKEGSLRTHEDGQRGSFGMSFMSIAKLLAPKAQA